MPVYEYQCTACGRIEETIQKFSDAPLTTCPHCSGQLQKLISRSSFHLKGSGWYVTDYAAPKTGSGNNGSGKAAENTKTDPGLPPPEASAPKSTTTTASKASTSA